jgi:hypothetical protein
LVGSYLESDPGYFARYRLTEDRVAMSMRHRPPNFGPNAGAVKRFLKRLSKLTVAEWAQILGVEESANPELRTHRSDVERRATAAIGRRSKIVPRARVEAFRLVMGVEGKLRTFGGRGAWPDDRWNSWQDSWYQADAAVSRAVTALVLRDRLSREDFESLYEAIESAVPLTEIDYAMPKL